MIATKALKLKFSKLDYCPECNRKLCRRTTVRETRMVEFRHKGSVVYGTELAIGCLGCGRQFIVSAEHGIIDEVNFGTD